MQPIPTPTSTAGGKALRSMLKGKSVLPALTVFHEELGDVFQISLGAFRPVFMVGPDASRFVLVTARDQLLWRPEHDPVTKLLRHGLLVTDGDRHDELRRMMMPALSRRVMGDYTETMWRSVDRIALDWSMATGPVDMLPEMRRIALLIVMETLFRVDMMSDVDRLVPVILDTIQYISPGLWTVAPFAPRLGYKQSLASLDAYLYKCISDRRKSDHQGDDLLSQMVNTADMSDDLIRDQMLTLLIAGHDTSTALLSWTLAMLGLHPSAMRKVRDEVDAVVGESTPALEHAAALTYMQQVLSETMRLYPPIHIGNRIAASDLYYDDYVIPAGTRVVYSIYLTHRHKKFWSNPDTFEPERFAEDHHSERPPYAYIPFGGGPRNCIGAAFAQVEVKLVLSRLLQRYDFQLANNRVHAHMGATLEPRPGVFMHIRRRS